MPRNSVHKPHSFRVSVSLDDAIAAYQWALNLERKSPDTIDNCTRTLSAFAAYCQEHNYPAAIGDITTEHVRCYLGSLTVASSSLASYHSRLRAFWNWAIDVEGIAVDNPLDGIRPPRPDQKIPDNLSPSEIRKLVDACRNGHSMHWRRDLALVLLLFDCGLRVSELCGITRDHWQDDRIKTMGKGRKERILPMSNATAKALWDYWHKERPTCSSEFVFLNKYDRPLSRSGVQRILNRRAGEAKIRHIHPHMLRHTFAYSWHEAGGPLNALQTMLGHTTPTMSLRYGRASAEEAARLHRQYSPVERLGLRIGEKRGKK